MSLTKIFTTTTALVVLGLGGYAFAQSFSSSNMEVTAEVQGLCSIKADNLDFGVYKPETGNTGSSKLIYACSRGIDATITIEYGNSLKEYCRDGEGDCTNGGKFDRAMLNKASGDSLGYRLDMKESVDPNAIKVPVKGTGGEVGLEVLGTLPAASELSHNNLAAPGRFVDVVEVRIAYN